MNKLLEVIEMKNMRLIHMYLCFFQGFGTFHEKEESILASNTHQVAPNKPAQQGKHQLHN